MKREQVKHRASRTKLGRSEFAFDVRSSGVLLHVTSLPGPHGSGDVGGAARAFADWLHAAGQRWWQMLPVGPPGAPPGNSPYSSTSSFAGSPQLIALEGLAAQRLLARDDAKVRRAAGFSDRNVNFPAVIRFREQRLRRAFGRFQQVSGGAAPGDFERFCAEHAGWLDDFALFTALKARHRGKPWMKWDRDLRLRKPAALRRARTELAAEIRFHQFVQFLFETQWQSLRRYCNDRGIGLIGDVPIFVSHDSADVWARRELFELDREGRPRSVSGVPPDFFNANGQLWGHPQYRWAAHQREGFAWWVQRFASMFRRFDAVRIDHFLGFARLWSSAATARTARHGHWIDVPGAQLLGAIRKNLGDVPIIAEDLGLLTPAAERLRDRFGLPGMRVLQFGFGDRAEYHLPHRYPRRCVAYPGTHDNDTLHGWLAALRRDPAKRAELNKCRAYLRTMARREFHWDAIAALMMSPADTTIFPLQDILGLGPEARMNTPGVAIGNWRWRVTRAELTPQLATRLHGLTELYDRLASA